MTNLRTAAQQALEALYEETAWFGPTPKGAAAIAALKAALAQQAESPCACWPSQMCSRQTQEPDDIKKQLANALDSAEFYRRRCEALQSWQSKMRDPERIIVCDILANGKTLDPAFAGDRYTAPPQKAEPMQEQVIEDAIEAAYWHFDARKKGLNEWASAPQSERDAFKAEARKLVRGYFPTRQAQDTKREMLAVADAFIRGKRSAQEQAEPDHETRAEIAEQRVVQLAEERDHYRNLWQKAQQDESETCTWHQDGDSDSGVYATSCGHYFRLEDGTPEDNKMAHCCYCGKKLVQELITEADDE